MRNGLSHFWFHSCAILIYICNTRTENKQIILYIAGLYEELRNDRDELKDRLGLTEERNQGQALEMSNLKEELASSLVMNKQVKERCDQLEERTRVTKESLLSDSDVRQSVIFKGSYRGPV